MKAIDGRLVFDAGDIGRQRLGGLEQADPEPFAAAVRLEDHRATGEMLLRCRGKRFLAGDQHRLRRGDAGHLERGVLPGLADLEVERGGAVDDPPSVPGEPSQDRRGQFGGMAMVAGVEALIRL